MSKGSGRILNTSSIDWALLKDVSRSFYLTLRILPAPVRESIGLAYLVARFSDTVVDGADSDAERQLLARREEIEGWLAASPDRGDIEGVWTTIREGQRFDQDRFSIQERSLLAKRNWTGMLISSPGAWVEFWTELCAKKMPGFAIARHCRDEGAGHSLWQRPPTREYPP